ncbi:MAG: helix-turn-helix domain-containing protein [Bryobacteraceae bacterium]
MPWKETRVSDERLKFITESLSGEATLVDLSRRFGISRKTSYKWKNRYKVSGVAGLLDLNRRPHSSCNAVAESIRQSIIKVRQQHPTWGARKRSGRGCSGSIPGRLASCEYDSSNNR